jgi:hypothetical protein
MSASTQIAAASALAPYSSLRSNFSLLVPNPQAVHPKYSQRAYPALTENLLVL